MQKKIKELVPNQHQQKLFNMCRTRWVARIDGLRIFKQCYVAILDALEDISNDRSYDPDARYKAVGIKKAVENFQFIVALALTVVERCLKCTKPLTLQLQSASLDAGKACEKVSFLFLTINDLRAEIEKTHDKFYEIALDLASERNITPSKPRTSGTLGECSSRVNVQISQEGDYHTFPRSAFGTNPVSIFERKP